MWSATDAEAWLTLTIPVNPQSVGRLSVGRHISPLPKTSFLPPSQGWFVFFCFVFFTSGGVMTTEEKLYVWTVRIATSRTLVTLPSPVVFKNPRPAGGFS